MSSETPLEHLQLAICQNSTPMKNCLTLPASLLMVMIAAAAVAQKGKPVKAGASQAVVLGTHQLPGEFGKIGTTYTIGKQVPLNVTLLSAEYRADRFVGGDFYGRANSFVPLKDQKLLVIKYTVQNPKGQDARLWYNSFAIIAVSADDVNSKLLNQPWIGTQTEYKEVQLKPGQKVTLSAAMFVPAQGEVPKLIIQREQDTTAAVVRYDLRGKVKKIADPAFSDDGITAKDTIDGQLATYYPWLGSDFQVIGVEDMATKIPDLGTPGDYKQVAIKLKFRGVTPEPGRVWYGDFNLHLMTSDGENTEFKTYSRLYRGGRNENFDGVVPTGEEQSFRLVVDVPNGATIQGISLTCHRDEGSWRTYKFSFK